ncbi:MAG: hypothetical protein RJA98_963 [Pseudomonadota bacterium]|jgi:hypothetical protein
MAHPTDPATHPGADTHTGAGGGTTRADFPADDAALRRQARRNVGLQLGFSIHALVFVAVHAGLFLQQALASTPSHRPWPLWGWALGLSIHGVVTLCSVRGGGLRERLVAAELARLRQRMG